MIWLFLLTLIWVGHHSLYLFIAFLCFPSSLLILVIIYLFLSYIDTCLWFITSFIACCIGCLTISFFYFLSSLTVTSIASEFTGSQDYSAHYILYIKVLGLIIGYLSLVSLHFFHPITPDIHYDPCRKTTQRPWDQTLSSIVFSWAGFSDWLKYGCCRAFPHGRCFEWHLISLPLGMMMFDRIWAWK